MEPWQLRRIRDGLLAFKALGKESTTSDYSWRYVEEEIRAETGVTVPEGPLSKFIIGEPHRDKAKRRLGMRIYPVPKEERLNAIIEFLTNPDSTGYVFRREDLDIYPSETLGPLRLMEYLNDGREAERFLSPQCLRGFLFFAKYSVEKKAVTVSLRFRDASHQGLVQFALLKCYADKFILPEIMEDKLKELTENGMSADRYRGWAILTPEENIFLLAKKDRNGENLTYFSLGIDKRMYQGEPANALVLMEHDFPIDTINVEQGGDEEDLLTAVRKSLDNHLLLFRRQAEETVDSAID